MNRYEFESLISDYVEGDLSFNKREEFEVYMEEDVSAKTLLNDVKKTLNEMKNIKGVATSDDFNSKLLLKVKDKTSVIGNNKNSIFGFTPFYASLFSSLCIAIFILGYTFIPDSNDILSNTNYSKNLNQKMLDAPVIKKYNSDVDLASDASADSVKENDKNYKYLSAQHDDLKDQLEKVNKDVGKKFGEKNDINQKIDELNQETETLIDEIEKWQT